MGISRVSSETAQATGTTFAASALDASRKILEADSMGSDVIFTGGIFRGEDEKNTAPPVGSDSMIHVADGQFMMLLDRERVVDYTAEPGLFRTSNYTSPLLIHGRLDEKARESYQRMRLIGFPSSRQQAVYITLNRVEGLKFGTRTPIEYAGAHDNGAMVLRMRGTFDILITDPFLFYQEIGIRSPGRVEADALNDHLLDEFLKAAGAAINRLAGEGLDVSRLSTHLRRLKEYVTVILNEHWKEKYGISLLSMTVSGFASSGKETMEKPSGAILPDSDTENDAPEHPPHSADSVEPDSVPPAKTENENAPADESAVNRAEETGSASSWICACGKENTPDSKFCGECGQRRPALPCSVCSYQLPVGIPANFCPQCGSPLKKP